MSRLSEYLSFRVNILFVAFILPFLVCSQNLIRNGGFEEYSVCPNTLGQADLAIGWVNTNMRSPDYFHTCSTYPLIAIPDNIMGHEFPNSGSGFIGLVTIHDNSSAVYGSEYISTEINPMEDGRKYTLESYVSLAELSRFYTRELGFYFSSEVLPSNLMDYSSFGPIYISSELLNVKNGWQKVQIEVVGSSDYKYLTIGFFSFPPEIEVFLSNPQTQPLHSIYYYLDDISLYPVEYHPNFQDTFLCLPEKLELKAPYYRDMSYRWYFESQWLSDSSSLNVENPATGWYVLHYTDFRNDIYMDSIYVEVQDCGSLELPNVFTPNNDGVHDIWAPITKDIGQLEIQIFNRWGKLVHQYSGPASYYSGWDGGDSPDGSYFAVVKAMGNTGRVMEEKGTLSLLR